MFDRHGKRKYLNEGERRAFYKAVKSDSNELHRTFGMTLYFTGCRISEALNLVSGRIDKEEKNFIFETLKRRRKGIYRAVPVPDFLAVKCGEAADAMEASERLWPFSRATGYRLIKDYMAKAGIKGVMASPKGLRHGFAVACLSEKIPLTTLQKWMGHARLETTAIYLDVSGEEERTLASRLWLHSS